MSTASITQQGLAAGSMVKMQAYTDHKSDIVNIPDEGVRILFFISLHCMHCIDLTPEISEIARAVPDAGFTVFSTGEREDNQEMAGYFDWDFSVISASQEEMENQFGITMLPAMVLLRDGVVQLTGVVYNKDDFFKLTHKVLP
ncbi:TlpA family protein disulfide reductase [Paenibacillus aurantiacus]|uniref:TlpA family protein disulfide reductase n=1 Tax=Paenibacillus aurantiacus TaxID=1936118 RepID=A0ABV5KGS2_9BACL